MISSCLSRTFLATLAALSAIANGQAGPNTLSQCHIKEMTMSVNGTWIVLPLPVDLVAKLVAPKKLIPIPSNSARYPNGWPAGTHPVTIQGSYSGSIKQLAFAIDILMGGRIEVPCVDQLNDGKTCFRQPITTYVGGVNGQLDSSLIPSAVGTAEGTLVRPGAYDPNNAALRSITNGQFFFENDAIIFGNPISGPGLTPQAFRFTIDQLSPTPPASSLLSELGFHFFISQPYIALDGIHCFRSETYFNQTFANPFFCNAEEVTVYDYALELNGIPTELKGDYQSGTCYGANGVLVGYMQQNCKDAIAMSGPAMDM